MPDALQQPLGDFIQDLDRLDRLLSTIGELRRFGSTVVPEVQPPDEFNKAAIALRGSVRSQGSEFPILAGTLLLYVAGRFEHFVRTSFEALCDSFAAKCEKFEHLPPHMRTNLVRQTAEVLAKPAKYGFDDVEVQTVICNLATNMSAETGLGPVNADCLSITEQNMNPVVLADLYKRIGIASLWVEFSKQAKLKLHFETDKDGEVERGAKAALENLMTERNSIAHPTSNPLFPDEEKVKGHISFLRVLAEVLTEISRVQMTAFKGTAGFLSQ
jgi:hypothetical protein